MIKKTIFGNPLGLYITFTAKILRLLDSNTIETTKIFAYIALKLMTKRNLFLV